MSPGRVTRAGGAPASQFSTSALLHLPWRCASLGSLLHVLQPLATIATHVAGEGRVSGKSWSSTIPKASDGCGTVALSERALLPDARFPLGSRRGDPPCRISKMCL